ncbi:DUF4034 domain-containing protein [Cellvibrio mixtus]|uniref:DUF4034 domain-containing protein n=1 Tax=Cellvibrio mixtus TaxID=39650 RepID=UPI00058708EF|nr:hypothetical protein [Cellvibrio mixtus]
MYVKRNHNGEVVAVSKQAGQDFSEQIAGDAPELLQFIQGEKTAEQLALEQTDQTMARVLEDVVNLLVEQGVIRFTDLPEAAQNKLLTRRELRGKRQSVYLLDDGDQLHL